MHRLIVTSATYRQSSQARPDLATVDARNRLLARQVRLRLEAEVVRDCPWQTESMTISELLTSQRRWGRTRARKFLMPLSMSENKQLGTLTPRQRAILAAELAARTSGASADALV